jgi:hypothetical protein
MPFILIPVVGAAIAAGVGVAIGAVTVAAAITSVAVTAAAAGLNYLLAEKPVGAPGYTSPIQAAPANSERTIAVRQAAPPRRFVLGKVRTGGAVFMQDNDNPNLYICSVLSDGPIGGIDRVFFGQTEVILNGTLGGTGLYTNKIQFEFGLGSTTQAVSSMLSGVTAFAGFVSSNYRQQGCARAIARLNWGADSQNNAVLWGNSLSPSYVVRGVLAYDPRDGSQVLATPSTWKYTANGALLTAFAITHVWGSPLDNADIDWTSVAAAANAADATLTYGGSTVPIFVTGGVFQAESEIASQVNSLLQSFGGAITLDNGLYRIDTDQARTSVFTITDDDILGVGEFQHAVSTEDLFGAISAQYFDINDSGQQATTPVYAVGAGAQRETGLSLPYCAAAHSAQILAYRALMKSRTDKAVSVTVTDAGLYLLPFVDVVTIASDVATFMNGTYEILQVDLQPEGVTLRLREYAPSAYADPATYLV